ncbi:MAG: glycosyltransferase family 39 protein [Caldilineales bacterium]|nr:glycosyltransferase family 39 protein [Caldilineales bacterium]
MKPDLRVEPRPWFPPLLLFALALALRVVVIVIWRFDGLYGQDAFAYYEQAAGILHSLTHGQSLPTDFFWPSGYPLQAAALMILTGQQPVAAQLVSALSGAALAPLIFLFCRALFPDRGTVAGWVAGITMAVAGQPLLSSVVIMADISGIFWLLLSAWLLVVAARKPRPGLWLLATGLSFGLAVVSRYPSLLAAPGFILYALLQVRSRTWRWRHLLPALAGAILVLAPQLWLSSHRPEGLMHPWLVEWNLGNAFRRQFDLIDGHFQYRLPIAIFYAQPFGHPAYLFPLFSLAALWGGWRLYLQRRWDALALLGGWIVAVYLFLTGIPFQNFRFGLTLYPPVVALAGFGVADLWTRVRWRRWLLAGLVVAWIGMLVWAYRTVAPFLAAQSRSKQIVTQVGEALPTGSEILAFGLTSTLQHYTDLHTQEFFYETPATLAIRLDRGEPWYLLVEPDDLQSQWAGKPPDVSFRWLQTHACLDEIARIGTWVLFAVRAGVC